MKAAPLSSGGLHSGFAERLRQRRVQLALRKQDLAAQVGVSLTTIQQYENGNCPRANLPCACQRRCAAPWTGCWRARATPTATPSTRPRRGWSWCPWWRRGFRRARAALKPAAKSCAHYAFGGIFCTARGNPAQMVLLRVSGDSMQPRILHNDVVLIDQSQSDPGARADLCRGRGGHGLSEDRQCHAGQADPDQRQSGLCPDRGGYLRTAGGSGADYREGGVGGPRTGLRLVAAAFFCPLGCVELHLLFRVEYQKSTLPP